MFFRFHLESQNLVYIAAMPSEPELQFQEESAQLVREQNQTVLVESEVCLENKKNRAFWDFNDQMSWS